MPIHKSQLEEFKLNPVWQAIVRRVETKLKVIDVDLDTADDVMRIFKMLGERSMAKYVRGLPDSMLANINALAENQVKGD